MSEVRVGCADLPPGNTRERFFSQLSYVESSLWLTGPVKAATWKKWCSSPAGALGIVAPVVITHPSGRGGPEHSYKVPKEPQQWGELRATPAVREHVALLGKVAAEGRASAVVFHTPPAFTPSQTNRDAVRRFFSEVAPAEAFGGATRVWRPDGLWEPTTAVKLASELGIVCAVDPLIEDPVGTPPGFYEDLPGESIYLRISGLGRPSRKLPLHDIERLAEIVSTRDRAWAVFATAERFRDARGLRTMLAEMPDASGDASDEVGDDAIDDDDEVDDSDESGDDVDDDDQK
jgi:uncharacterized protein YecE (DUF72 family)